MIPTSNNIYFGTMEELEVIEYYLKSSHIEYEVNFETSENLTDDEIGWVEYFGGEDESKESRMG
jgi:hypothetical protein